jgi:ATP-binding cassette, subfamily B, bacterial MsbA
MLDLLFNKLFPFIRPYKAKVIGAILLSFCLAAIGGLQVSLVKPLFDQGLSPESSREEVYLLAAKLLGLGLLNFPCRFLHFYWMRFIMERATCAVRASIFNQLLKLPTAFYQKSKQGNLISNILNDTQVFSQGFKAALDLIREPLKASVYLGMAFWADWQLTLVILFMAPFLILIFGISGRKVKNNQGHVQVVQGEFTHNINEGLASHKITKAFNLQNFVFERFQKSQDHFFKAQMKTSFVEEMAHPFVEVVGAMAFAAVIVFAHHRIQSGPTTIGQFISFIAALALFMDPIRKFSQANVKLSQAQAANDRLSELIDLPQERDHGTHKIENFTDSIQIKNLSFSYGEGDVVTDLSLEIKKGQKVALVGLSGSGKSTLINLLLGLYPVDRGEIIIDQVGLEDIQLSSLRDLFGFVGQDIFLFHDSVRNNLCIGKAFTEEQIDEALKVACAHEFVDKLPKGLDTIIGDRGALLSGGQKQRLTIARAYLQDTPILLFDEATSALDNESEKIVQQALENLAGHKTVIAVAHRLSTIQDYDRIYVLHDGQVVEFGDHQQLMGQDGEYAKLYQLAQK